MPRVLRGRWREDRTRRTDTLREAPTAHQSREMPWRGRCWRGCRWRGCCWRRRSLRQMLLCCRRCCSCCRCPYGTRQAWGVRALSRWRNLGSALRVGDLAVLATPRIVFPRGSSSPSATSSPAGLGDQGPRAPRRDRKPLQKDCRRRRRSSRLPTQGLPEPVKRDAPWVRCQHTARACASRRDGAL